MGQCAKVLAFYKTAQYIPFFFHYVMNVSVTCDILLKALLVLESYSTSHPKGKLNHRPRKIALLLELAKYFSGSSNPSSPSVNGYELAETKSASGPSNAAATTNSPSAHIFRTSHRYCFMVGSADDLIASYTSLQFIATDDQSAVVINRFTSDLFYVCIVQVFVNASFASPSCVSN